MYLTWFDSNSWLIEMAGQRILLDPWFVGPLVFGNLNWFFKAERPQPQAIPDQIDLILLSQGLPDHAHPPTLKQLDPKIPVIGSVNAAQVARQLGYTQVTALEHGHTITWANQLEIQAFPGSPIGPVLKENAFLLKDLSAKTSLYYEPHGFHSPTLQAVGTVDVVITPIVDLTLPLLGSFIKGGESTLAVVQQLHPQVVLPTTASAEIVYTGLLNRILGTRGSIEAFRQRLTEKQSSAQVLNPKPGERFEVQLSTLGVT